MISDKGVSAWFGVGVGVGTSLSVKSGGIKKRSGVYASGEIMGRYGPLGVGTDFEIDPCGNLTQTPGKFTVGSTTFTEEGNLQGSLNPQTHTQEAAGSTELSLQGKLTAKYCATTLD